MTSQSVIYVIWRSWKNNAKDKVPINADKSNRKHLYINMSFSPRLSISGGQYSPAISIFCPINVAALGDRSSQFIAQTQIIPYWHIVSCTASCTPSYFHHITSPFRPWYCHRLGGQSPTCIKYCWLYISQRNILSMKYGWNLTYAGPAVSPTWRRPDHGFWHQDTTF